MSNDRNPCNFRSISDVDAHKLADISITGGIVNWIVSCIYTYFMCTYESPHPRNPLYAGETLNGWISIDTYTHISRHVRTKNFHPSSRLILSNIHIFNLIFLTHVHRRPPLGVPRSVHNSTKPEQSRANFIFNFNIIVLTKTWFCHFVILNLQQYWSKINRWRCAQ